MVTRANHQDRSAQAGGFGQLPGQIETTIPVQDPARRPGQEEASRFPGIFVAFRPTDQSGGQSLQNRWGSQAQAPIRSRRDINRLDLSQEAANLLRQDQLGAIFHFSGVRAGQRFHRFLLAA
jgi:hypothetical protein